MSRYQRIRKSGEEQRTTALELFYDLVFVFAITQISHLIIHPLTWQAAGHALIVLLVVWWAWNYTTWVTNELDPDSIVVRLVLIGIMIASLVMAIAIPQAFGKYGLLFASSYFVIQVGRHAFLTFVAASRHTLERERALHILIWLTTAGVFWIAGGLAEGPTRVALWLVALAIDYTGPIMLYRIPLLPKLHHTSFDVESSHFAERFQLFMIIALGESIVLTGATTSELTLTAARMTAFTLAFLGTAAMWWLYFTYVAGISQRRLELAGNDRTALARDGFTYLHVVMVAGIVIWAVGNAIVIAHPAATLTGREITAVVAGPATYLFGHTLFRLRMAGSISWKRLGAAIVCVAVGVVGVFSSALVVMGLVVAVMIGLIVAENVVAFRRNRRGDPSPLDLLEASA